MQAYKVYEVYKDPLTDSGLTDPQYKYCRSAGERKTLVFSYFHQDVYNIALLHRKHFKKSITNVTRCMIVFNFDLAVSQWESERSAWQ